MANIDSQLSKIRSSERGEDVRDSIISALRDINNDVPADISNPERYVDDMPQSSDLSVTFNPPKLINQLYIKQAGSGGKSTNLVVGKFTENGTYPDDDPDYDPDEERRYYKKVDVNVPQLANKVIDLEEEINQNGTFSAFDFGADGLRSFTVNVNPTPVSGTFEVRFYAVDKTTVLKTELVPAYGKASCNVYDGMTINGEYFKGWNPTPSNVTRNMDCYPMFGEVVIGGDDIDDDWPIICEKRGAGYPLGSKKSLVVNIPARYTNGELVWQTINSGEWKSNGNGHILHDAMNIAMHMIKVAEGEDGTTSTWLSTGVIPIYPYWVTPSGARGGPSYSSNVQAYSMWQVYSDTHGAVNDAVTVDWEGSAQREYLNAFLIENLPECLGTTIKPVNKMFASFNRAPHKGTDVGSNYGDVKVYKSSIDKIWIPSMQELHSYFEAHVGWGDYNADLEPNGIDYSAIYMPTYPGSFLTRTTHIGTNFINCISALGQNITAVTAGCPGAPIGFCL